MDVKRASDVDEAQVPHAAKKGRSEIPSSSLPIISASINALPSDTLLMIFALLPVRPRVWLLSRVCRRWSNVVFRSFTSVSMLKSVWRPSGPLLARLWVSPYLSELCLPCDIAGGVSLTSAQLPSLVSLGLLPPRSSKTCSCTSFEELRPMRALAFHRHLTPTSCKILFNSSSSLQSLCLKVGELRYRYAAGMHIAADNGLIKMVEWIMLNPNALPILSSLTLEISCSDEAYDIIAHLLRRRLRNQVTHLKLRLRHIQAVGGPPIFFSCFPRLASLSLKLGKSVDYDKCESVLAIARNSTALVSLAIDLPEANLLNDREMRSLMLHSALTKLKVRRGALASDGESRHLLDELLAALPKLNRFYAFSESELHRYRPPSAKILVNHASRLVAVALSPRQKEPREHIDLGLFYSIFEQFRHLQKLRLSDVSFLNVLIRQLSMPHLRKIIWTTTDTMPYDYYIYILRQFLSWSNLISKIRVSSTQKKGMQLEDHSRAKERDADFDLFLADAARHPALRVLKLHVPIAFKSVSNWIDVKTFRREGGNGRWHA